MDYKLLYQIAQNTAGTPPAIGDGIYALAYKIVQNTAGTAPAVGDGLYDLFYKFAQNTAASPKVGDGLHDLLFKTAKKLGGNPLIGDGLYDLLYKIAGKTAGGGGGSSLDSDAVAQQTRIVADGGVVTDVSFLSSLIGDLKAAGCYALLDALYIPIACKKDGANRVSKLYDLSLAKSGVYYDAIQNTAASQQLWEASKVDGKPWVLFDPLRTGGYLSAPVVPYTGYPFTYFIISRATTAGDSHKTIFGRMSDVDRLDVVNYFGQSLGIVYFVGANAALNMITNPVTTGQFTCLFNGASTTLRRKGAQVGTGDPGAIGPMSNLRFSIGDYRTFWPHDGSVAFAAACCRAITTQQRDAIENLLNTKYYPSTVA